MDQTLQECSVIDPVCGYKTPDSVGLKSPEEKSKGYRVLEMETKIEMLERENKRLEGERDMLEQDLEEAQGQIEKLVVDIKN